MRSPPTPIPPADVLTHLATDTFSQIRCNTATNPSTLPATLDRLADDRYSFIQIAVIRNPHTATTTLERLMS